MDEIENTKPADPKWVKAQNGRFFRLALLDPESEGLNGQGGVFVVWHSGVRPRWIAVGAADDLARTFHEIGNNPEVTAFEVHGGVWVTWSPILEQFRSGAARYLTRTLKPLLDLDGVTDPEAKMIPVLPPGASSGVAWGRHRAPS